MVKITIEREGQEPIVIKCDNYILRADNGTKTFFEGHSDLRFLSSAAMYINELARNAIQDDIRRNNQ